MEKYYKNRTNYSANKVVIPQYKK